MAQGSNQGGAVVSTKALVFAVLLTMTGGLLSLAGAVAGGWLAATAWFCFSLASS